MMATLEFLQFMYYCWISWRFSRRKRDQGVSYITILSPHGVPQLVFLIGRGRDAWQVSNFAAEHALTRHAKPADI